MRSTADRRLTVLEQRRGIAPSVVRIRDGETAETAAARHWREYPHALGKPAAILPMPCATAEEWVSRHAPRDT